MKRIILIFSFILVFVFCMAGFSQESRIQEMFTRSTFTPENLHYAIIEGGRHDIDACERYIYYALQDFFGEETGAAEA